MPTRTANTVWRGDLKDGKGSMKFGGGGFEGQYSFASRFEEGPGTNPEETGGDTVAVPAPDARFDAFCGGGTWSDSLADLTLPETSGAYSGYNAGHEDLKKGTVESSKIIPPHPFWVKTVRVLFGGGKKSA